MKTIVRNQKNIIECECGTVLEYENNDCSLAFSDKKKGLLQIVVKCPTCNKIHKTTVSELDAISLEDSSIKKTTKQELTFKQIKDNPELVEVGYQKSITLKNGLEVVVELAGKNHDLKPDGSKTKLSFVLRDLLGKDDDNNMDAPMNDENTNKGGWKDCKMRKWLNADILALLPDDLVELIETVKKETFCDSKLIETEDKLWLLSENEIFGMQHYAPGTEGEQYDLFKHYRNRVKGHLGSDCADYYWERSSNSGSTSNFCFVSSVGNANYNYASSSRGVAFGFCL